MNYKPSYYSSLKNWVEYLRPFHKDKTVKQITEIAKTIKSKLSIPKQKEPPKNKFEKIIIENSNLGYIASSKARNNNKRIQNWRSAKPTSSWVNEGYYDSINCGRYSRSCTYTKWEYEPKYTSFILIGQSGRGVIYYWGFSEDKKKKFISAPKGMVFKKNCNGIFLERISDKMDYHVTSQDLLSKNFATHIRKIMAENYLKRIESNKIVREQKRFQKIFDREVNKTYVNFLDARRAGNCVAGITSWAKAKLNMEREQLLDAPWLTQVPAKLLLRLDPNNQLVKNSINQAFLRETTISI